MRHLFYTNYQSGQSGLSNGIMSVEVGVVLAFLTNRFLLLDGNVSPPANIVSYGDRVDNSRPSRVTDLIEIPVPWSEPDEVELGGLRSRELTDYSLWQSAFYVPGTLDIDSEDAKSFLRGREVWVCESEDLAEADVLRVSETPLMPGTDQHRRNLSFYSYFFYLDPETRRSAYRVLDRMRPKSPYAELARRVADDLGSFNAVHMRRGDFKVTYGVTVLDRHPWEAIEALEKHFSPDDRLLICTDERNDPFFDEINAHWPDHVYIDHHILDNYAAEFKELPQNDSLALAYLTQLVAGESEDFVGTMTSTFTSMIQRQRGNNGKEEPFKFLWNELPEPGERLERGRHPVSDCVPLEDGVMVREFEGPYSWNHYTSLLNPAWMREWPESFLLPEVLETGELAGQAPMLGQATDVVTAGRNEAVLDFEGLGVRFNSDVPGLALKLSESMYAGDGSLSPSVIAEFEISQSGEQIEVQSGGDTVARVEHSREVPRALLDYVVPLLARARPGHCWFNGMVFERNGRAILYTGDESGPHSKIADELCQAGWELIGDTAIPLHPESLETLPFARCNWPRGASARIMARGVKLVAAVDGRRMLHRRGRVNRLSPAVAVAELIRGSRDFGFDREKAVKQLCTVAESLPVYGLTFSDPVRAARSLQFLAETDQAETAK